MCVANKETQLDEMTVLETLLRDFEAAAIEANASEEDLATIRKMRQLCSQQKALLSGDSGMVH
jgi:hypothetical protein